MGGVNQVGVMAVEHNHVFLAETLLALYVECILRTVYLNSHDEAQLFYLFISELAQVAHAVWVIHGIKVECEPYVGSAARGAERTDQSVLAIKGLAIDNVFFNV